MKLLLLHPEWAHRPCGECIRYVYDADGRQCVNPITGVPIPRDADTPLECESCPKIPAGAPKNRFQAVELDERGWKAYLHYRRCKAVGRFEDDEAVEAVAGLIGQVEERVAESRQWQQTLAVMKAALASSMAGGGQR